MPLYNVGVDREPPFPRSEDPLRWSRWAEENAPFASVTGGQLADYIVKAPDRMPNGSVAVMMQGGFLTPAELRELPNLERLPDQVRKVIEFGIKHDYPVTFTPQ
jgi:hypothetical protein